MSRIYFHTQHDGEAEVLGAERAWLNAQNRRVTMLAMPDRERVLSKVRPDHWLHDRTGEYWTQGLLTAISVGESVFTHDGEPVATFDLVLNTALRIGTDEACLIARLDGQCEIHGYIEGANRTWGADLIERCLENGLLRYTVTGTDKHGRPRQPSLIGWLDVIELLRRRDDEPVVMSYSVCDGWPNERVALGADPDDDMVEDESEEWAELSRDERWRRALDGLRGRPHDKRDLSPENLRAPFGHSLSLIDLFA